MPDKNQLDNILKKLINISDGYLDAAMKTNTVNKDLIESVCIVLSIAYERSGSVGK